MSTKSVYWLAGIVFLGALIYGLGTAMHKNQKQISNVSEQEATSTSPGPVEVIPISHATMLLRWGDLSLYTDPVGSVGKIPVPDIIFVTDIHGDHFSTSTLLSIVEASTTLIVPQAVKDGLGKDLASHAKVMKNGETISEKGFSISAIPMYNLPESPKAYHTKGRGNGYVIERDGFRVYVAGDTSGIPEMRSLKDINIAFVPMNLPYTMSVEEAAIAVLDFKPKEVYPYHYRGQDGFSDVNKFKQLVNTGNPNIEVVLRNWYPTGE